MAKITEEMPGTTLTEEERVAIAISSGGTTGCHPESCAMRCYIDTYQRNLA